MCNDIGLGRLQASVVPVYIQCIQCAAVYDVPSAHGRFQMVVSPGINTGESGLSDPRSYVSRVNRRMRNAEHALCILYILPHKSQYLLHNYAIFSCKCECRNDRNPSRYTYNHSPPYTTTTVYHIDQKSCTVRTPDRRNTFPPLCPHPTWPPLCHVQVPMRRGSTSSTTRKLML